MTFENPREGAAFESPIEDGTYAVCCIGTEEGDNLGYGPTIRWAFWVYDRHTAAPINHADGSPFVLEVLSSTKLTRSEKGNSKAYDWATALVGGSIDQMSGAQVAEAVKNCWAVATIVHNTKGYPQIAENGLKPWSEPPAQRQPAAAAPAAPPRPTPPQPAELAPEDTPF